MEMRNKLNAATNRESRLKDELNAVKPSTTLTMNPLLGEMRSNADLGRLLAAIPDDTDADEALGQIRVAIQHRQRFRREKKLCKLSGKPYSIPFHFHCDNAHPYCRGAQNQP